LRCIQTRKGDNGKEKRKQKSYARASRRKSKKEKGQVICRSFCKFLSAMNGGGRKEGREVEIK